MDKKRYWQRDDEYWNGCWPTASRISFSLFWGTIFGGIAAGVKSAYDALPWDIPFGEIWELILPAIPIFLIMAAIYIYISGQKGF